MLEVSKDKQVLKFIKKRVGHTSVPRGRERKELSNILAAMRKVVAKHD